MAVGGSGAEGGGRCLWRRAGPLACTRGLFRVGFVKTYTNTLKVMLTKIRVHDLMSSVAGAIKASNVIIEFYNFGAGLSAAGARVLRNLTLCSF